MNKNELKKNRQDIVLGVVLAMITGFFVNTISSIFYDIAIAKTLKLGEIDLYMYYLLFVIGAIIFSFLKFLIVDIKKSDIIDKSFFKRYSDFIENEALFYKLNNWFIVISVIFLAFYLVLLYPLIIIFYVIMGIFYLYKK